MDVKTIVDLLKALLPDWAAFTIPFVLAAIAGLYLGSLFARMRYQSSIDGLEKTVGFLEKQLTFRSAADLGASAPATPAQKPDYGTFAEPDRAKMPTAPHDPRFTNLNNQIINETDAKIQRALRTTTYTFVYNPKTGRAKTLTFKAGGYIGEGRNDNEHRWRVSRGRLELLNSKLEVYSRFYLLPDGRSFHHTNDDDVPSIKGQYMTPIEATPMPQPPPPNPSVNI